MLRKHLSPKAFHELLSNKCFEDNIVDIAMDLGECYICNKCGKEALVLDVKESNGTFKCFYCGDFFYAAYSQCDICRSNNSVIYDDLNIEINGNVVSGYSYRCNKKSKIYKCPKCGCIYNYQIGQSVREYHYEYCRENHFRC